MFCGKVQVGSSCFEKFMLILYKGEVQNSEILAYFKQLKSNNSLN